MTTQLKTYSVLINWNDHDREQGTFGATVRAKDPDDAERLARLEMWNAEGDEGDDPQDTGGSIVDVSEGAAWMASELEEALRDIVAASDANDGGSLANAVEAARALLDKIGGGA